VEAFALLGFGAALVPLGLIILLIVAVTGGRNEPDPDAERPAALYYAGVLFITVFIVLFSIFGIASSLLNLTTDSSGGASFGFDDESGQTFSSNAEDDADWATAVRALIVGGVAAGLYVFHDPRRRRRTAGLVTARVRRTYTYVVSFVAVVVALISAIAALFALFDIIAPGIAGASGTRGDSTVELFQALILTVLAAGLALWHLREAEPGDAAIGIAPVVPPEPPGPPPIDLESTPAPRKKRTAPLKAQGR
jgi:hypothetical protein